MKYFIKKYIILSHENMTLLVQHKFAHYRRYELDIWGACFNDSKAALLKPNYDFKDLVNKVRSPYFKFFYKLYIRRRLLADARNQRHVYRLDMLPPDRPKNKFKERFLSIRLTRLYFITFQDHQFRALLKKARKLDGSFIKNYFYLLEGRALMVLYRTLFVPTPFDAIHIIKTGDLYFDGHQIRSLRAIITIGKFISLSKRFRYRAQLFLAARVEGSAAIFNVPNYMFVSFNFMIAILLRLARKEEYLYPINVDVQRITGYY